MSIWLQTLLAEAAVAATTQAATSATTRAAPVPPSTYGWAMLQASILLLAGVVLFLATYGRKQRTWAARRMTDRHPGRPLWVVGAAMVWCFLAVPLFVASSRSNTNEPLSDATRVLAYAAACGTGLIAAGVLHFLMRRSRAFETLGLLPLRTALMPGRTLVAAAMALPFTYLIAAASVLAWQLLQLQHEPAHAMLQLMERNESTPWVVWVTIANATLLAPVFEEVLFRGHLQTALSAALPRFRWPAIVISSLLFASMHDAWTAPAILALSIAIGIAYEWSGSLWVAIGVHIAFNVVSTVGFLAGQ